MVFQDVEIPAEFPVEMTKEAWTRYNEFDEDLRNYGLAAPDRDTYSPTLDRLSKSALKAAMLMAASRQNPQDNGNKVIVELDDILRSIHYAERWREHSIDILDNIGKSVTERRVEYVMRVIRQHKQGIRRSKVMQLARLTAREADWVLETLEQRAMIRRQRQGKGELVTPVSLTVKK